MNLNKKTINLFSEKLTDTDLKKFRTFKREQHYAQSYCQRDFISAFCELAASMETKPLIKAWVKHYIINKAYRIWYKSSFISIVSFPIFCYIGIMHPYLELHRNWYLHWGQAYTHWYWWIEYKPFHEKYIADFNEHMAGHNTILLKDDPVYEKEFYQGSTYPFVSSVHNSEPYIYSRKFLRDVKIRRRRCPDWYSKIKKGQLGFRNLTLDNHENLTRRSSQVHRLRSRSYGIANNPSHPYNIAMRKLIGRQDAGWNNRDFSYYNQRLGRVYNLLWKREREFNNNDKALYMLELKKTIFYRRWYLHNEIKWNHSKLPINVGGLEHKVINYNPPTVAYTDAELRRICDLPWLTQFKSEWNSRLWGKSFSKPWTLLRQDGVKKYENTKFFDKDVLNSQSWYIYDDNIYKNFEAEAEGIKPVNRNKAWRRAYIAPTFEKVQVENTPIYRNPTRLGYSGVKNYTFDRKSIDFDYWKLRSIVNNFEGELYRGSIWRFKKERRSDMFSFLKEKLSSSGFKNKMYGIKPKEKISFYTKWQATQEAKYFNSKAADIDINMPELYKRLEAFSLQSTLKEFTYNPLIDLKQYTVSKVVSKVINPTKKWTYQTGSHVGSNFRSAYIILRKFNEMAFPIKRIFRVRREARYAKVVKEWRFRDQIKIHSMNRFFGSKRSLSLWANKRTGHIRKEYAVKWKLKFLGRGRKRYRDLSTYKTTLADKKPLLIKDDMLTTLRSKKLFLNLKNADNLSLSQYEGGSYFNNMGLRKKLYVKGRKFKLYGKKSIHDSTELISEHVRVDRIISKRVGSYWKFQPHREAPIDLMNSTVSIVPNKVIPEWSYVKDNVVEESVIPKFIFELSDLYGLYYKGLFGKEENPYYSFMIKFAYRIDNMDYLDWWVFRVFDLSYSLLLYPIVFCFAFWCSSNIGKYTTISKLRSYFLLEYNKCTYGYPFIGVLKTLFVICPYVALLIVWYLLPNFFYFLSLFEVGIASFPFLWLFSMGIHSPGLTGLVGFNMWFWLALYIPGPMQDSLTIVVARIIEFLVMTELWGDNRWSEEAGSFFVRAHGKLLHQGQQGFKADCAIYKPFKRWGGNYSYHENVRVALPCGPRTKYNEGSEWNGGFIKNLKGKNINYKVLKSEVAEVWYESWQIRQIYPDILRLTDPKSSITYLYRPGLGNRVNDKLPLCRSLGTRPWANNILIMRRGDEIEHPWRFVTERYPDLVSSKSDLNAFMVSEKYWKRQQDILPIKDFDLYMGTLGNFFWRFFFRWLILPVASFCQYIAFFGVFSFRGAEFYFEGGYLGGFDLDDYGLPYWQNILYAANELDVEETTFPDDLYNIWSTIPRYFEDYFIDPNSIHGFYWENPIFRNTFCITNKGGRQNFSISVDWREKLTGLTDSDGSIMTSTKYSHCLTESYSTSDRYAGSIEWDDILPFLYSIDYTYSIYIVLWFLFGIVPFFLETVIW